MKKNFVLLISIFFFLFFSHCGKKGALLPPLVKTPEKIEKINVSQRGGHIILDWVNPSHYLKGSTLLETNEIEIWILMLEKQEESEDKKDSIKIEEFKKQAKLLARIKKENFSEYEVLKSKNISRFRYFYKLCENDLKLKKLVFSLRVFDDRKKSSEFSELIFFRPKIIPLSPQELKTSIYEDRIEIKWHPPEKKFDQSFPPDIKGYNIYRSDEGEEWRQINNQLIKEEKYVDRNFSFGKIYRYFVRISAYDSSSLYESEDSEVVEALPEDVFAPEIPTGLIYVSGEDFISLTWDANSERDLAGYHVWRKLEGEEKYILLTPKPILENAYNDTTVEKNERYYYAVSALDNAGNESKKSEYISEIIREACYENL